VSRRPAAGPPPRAASSTPVSPTLYTTQGSLTGSGEADQTFNSDGSSDIKNGTFSLTKGTFNYTAKLK